MLTIAGFDRVDFINNICDDKPSFTIWFSGCTHHCDECHNPTLWDKNNGDRYNIYDLIKILEDHKNKYGLYTVVLLGGEPLQQNLEDMSILCAILHVWKVKVWLYTGYNLNEASERMLYTNILCNIDYMKCGKYDKQLAQVGFPSSTNQRLYNITDFGASIIDITNKEEEVI